MVVRMYIREIIHSLKLADYIRTNHTNITLYSVSVSLDVVLIDVHLLRPSHILEQLTDQRSSDQLSMPLMQ